MHILILIFKLQLLGGKQNMTIQEIFTVKNIIIYFVIINIIGFLIMYIDKQKAKKGKWRIPEKMLFIITAVRWWNRNNSRNVYIQA